MGSCSRATVHPTCIHSLTATRFSGRQKEPLRHLGPQQPDLHPQRCPSPCSPAPQPAQNTNPLLMEQVGGPAVTSVPPVRVLPIGVLPNPRHYNLWGQTFPDHRSPGDQSHLGGTAGLLVRPLGVQPCPLPTLGLPSQFPPLRACLLLEKLTLGSPTRWGDSAS